MKRAFHGVIMATLLAGVCSGCQSLTGGTGAAGVATIRGQSPVATTPVFADELPKDAVAQAGHYHTPVRSTVSELRDAHQEHHNTSTYYYNGDGQPIGPGFGHGPGHWGHGQGYVEGYGNCPPGDSYGYCPPGGKHMHGGYAACRQDRFSYGYRVPNDLVYPAENAVGGAVVYPYYTHRGPSDFFRK